MYFSRPESECCRRGGGRPAAGDRATGQGVREIVRARLIKSGSRAKWPRREAIERERTYRETERERERSRRERGGGVSIERRERARERASER